MTPVSPFSDKRNTPTIQLKNYMRNLNKFLIRIRPVCACTTAPCRESPDATGGREEAAAPKIYATPPRRCRPGNALTLYSAMRLIPASNRLLPDMLRSAEYADPAGHPKCRRDSNDLYVTRSNGYRCREHGPHCRNAGWTAQGYVLHFDEDQNSTKLPERLPLAACGRTATIQFSARQTPDG